MKDDYQPDSRDYVPPPELAHVFRLIEVARRNMRLDGDGPETAMDNLIEAVEDLAKCVAAGLEKP